MMILLSIWFKREPFSLHIMAKRFEFRLNLFIAPFSVYHIIILHYIVSHLSKIHLNIFYCILFLRKRTY